MAFAPSDARTIYAFIESTDSGLFISHDGGATWERGDKSQWMVWRPFYFANLIVDPKNAKRVFKTDGSLILSEDGGRSFTIVGGFQGAHGDLHDVFIDPANSQHVFAGDDGGLWISYDGGNKWWKTDNLPISQFYHVSLDNTDPYHVYGGLQDNSSWVGDSAYPGGITSSRWENMYGGDGFWMFADPSDPAYVYAEYQGGTIGRVNMRTHEVRDIQPKLGTEDLKRYKKLRFNWNTPIALSPHDPATVYIGAQFLFRSRDHGQTWERISPDLTTNDPQEQKQEQSGGVTVDNSSAEMHTTIYSISESPLTAGLIWVGTDDGNLQLTRDGGGHWDNVIANMRGVPKGTWVNWVQASALCAGNGLRGARPAYLRRHGAVRVRHHGFRQDLVAVGNCRGLQERARLRARDQGGHASIRSCCFSARSSDCGSRWTAGRTGRSSRAATSRRSRCAIWRFSRATTIWCWPPMDAASGSSTTSLRCVS